VSSIVGLVRNASGTSIGGVDSIGVDAGLGAALAVGVGVGPSRREAGTSGATGPCTSDGGGGWSAGRRKSLTRPLAGIASTATGRATARASLIERIGRSGRLGKGR
jgi:hypothetical protein